jgi:hypothetical protein
LFFRRNRPHQHEPGAATESAPAVYRKNYAKTLVSALQKSVQDSLEMACRAPSGAAFQTKCSTLTSRLSAASSLRSLCPSEFQKKHSAGRPLTVILSNRTARQRKKAGRIPSGWARRSDKLA